MKYLITAAVVMVLSISVAKADIVTNNEVSVPNTIIHGMTDTGTNSLAGNRHGQSNPGGGTTTPPEAIPEPATALLVGLSLLGAGLMKRRVQHS